MGDVRRFLARVWSHSSNLMTGSLVVSLALTIGGWALDQALLIPLFFVVLLACFVIAAFRTWREADREARPYDAETWQHAQSLFAGLAEADREKLERLAIAKNLPLPDPGKLEQLGLVIRDPTTGSHQLHLEYAKIVPRLVKDWRARGSRP
jgi:hypothetical protein